MALEYRSIASAYFFALNAAFPSSLNFSARTARSSSGWGVLSGDGTWVPEVDGALNAVGEDGSSFLSSARRMSVKIYPWVVLGCDIVH